MNRLISAVLNADKKHVAQIVGEEKIEKLLLQRWGDDQESSLLLAHRLANLQGHLKSTPASVPILASLKQAFQSLPIDRIPLPEAVVSGRIDAIEHHLANNKLTKENKTEYHKATAYAAAIGDVDMIQRFLEAGVDVETRVWDKTLLMIAAESGRESAVELLLQRKADPNARQTTQPGMQGPTVIMLATQQSNVKIIDKLIAAGGDPMQTDSLGHSARELTRSKKVRALLDSHARTVNHATLQEAITADSVPSVRRLLGEGANLHAVNNKGDAPIMVALRIGNLEVIQLLVDAGASLDFTEVWSCALADRSGKDTSALVTRLCALGVDVNRRNTNHLPPLFMNGDPAVLRELLNAGANPHAYYAPSITWQDICFQAIQLCVSKQKMPRPREDETMEETMASLTAGFEVMNRQMAVVGYLKEKGQAFFENPEQNRTTENAEYFELYARAKAAAEAAVRRLTAQDYYKMYGNRKAIQFLREYLGTTKDAYDAAAEELKAFGKGTNAAFQAEVERVSKILSAKPQPWKKRKGVIHFIAALHKTLPGYFQTEAESAQFTPDDAVYGFEGVLLARLQAEVRERGFTLVWTEKRWNDRPMTRLLLLPSSNDLTALAACGTNRNTGEDSREVVNWCDTLRRTHPFHLLGASFDSMELGFQQPIPQPTELARAIAAFCTEFEVAPTDESALAELARELEANDRCFFWWD